MPEKRRERRKHLRQYFAEYVPVTLISMLGVGKRQAQKAAILDLSDGGICLLTKEPLPVRKDFYIIIHARGIADDMKLRANVRWGRKVPKKEGYYQIGFSFTKLSSLDKDQVNRLLEESSVLEKMEDWKKFGLPEA